MQPSIDKAFEFLNDLNRTTINVVAINPKNGAISGATGDNIRQFIAAHIENNNLYYTANEPSPSAPHNKLKKEHIANLWGVWLDADPRKGADLEREKIRLAEFATSLQDLPLPPSTTINSGNGIQAFWYLRKPIPATKENINTLESLGRGIAVKYNVDAVQNIDRIMRLPFTTNIPTANKQAVGRVSETATVTHLTNNTYPLKALLTLAESMSAPDYNDNKEYDFKFETCKKLPDDLMIKWQSVRQDHKIDGIFKSDLPSRSEYDMALISRLKDLNWSIDEISKVMCLFSKGKGQDITKREIIRCYARAKGALSAMALSPDLVNFMMDKPNPTLIIEKDIEKEYDDAGELSWEKTATPLLKGLIDQGTVISIFGQSNVGKSFIASDIAAHIALGRDWGGYKCKGKGSVLYVAAEASATYGVRMSAVKLRVGVPHKASIRDFPYGVYSKPISLYVTDKETSRCDGVNKIVEQAQNLVKRSELPCKLIVIDTLAAVFGGGNENSFDDMGVLIKHLNDLAYRTKATILIVHHSGKDQTAGLRGHTSLNATLDTVLEVKTVTVGGKERRELIAKKQRDNDKGCNVEFNLKVIKLGDDVDGDPVTSCQIMLKSDSEFESVIPDKYLGLKPHQETLLKAIEVCNIMSDNSEANLYSLFNYIRPIHIISVTEVLKEGVDKKLIPVCPLIVSKKTFDRYTRQLLDKKLIEKNDKKEWVISF